MCSKGIAKVNQRYIFTLAMLLVRYRTLPHTRLLGAVLAKGACLLYGQYKTVRCNARMLGKVVVAVVVMALRARFAANGTTRHVTACWQLTFTYNCNLYC